MQTTAEQTAGYIKDHPYIKSCLKKDLINYSALARLISSELKIEKKTSKEAILVAARRFQEKLRLQVLDENKIKLILHDSEIEFKNKIMVLIVKKDINYEILMNLQKEIKKDSGVSFIQEGSDIYTIILPDKYQKMISSLQKYILKKKTNLALILLKSSAVVEDTIGFVAYLTSLFAENGVNILEFLSCWKDTLFVIESKDVARALQFLKF